MNRVVVALACAATLAACTDKKRDECTGVVTATKGAHAAVTATYANAPDASIRDLAHTATSLTNAAVGGSSSVRALSETLTTASLKSVTAAYATALDDTGEAARAIAPLTEKIATLDRSIRGNQSANMWATALSASQAIQQRCKAASPPSGCAYVVQRLAPLDSLANDPDALTKLAGVLEAAPHDDQQFEVTLYDFEGTLRVAATGLRAMAHESEEKRAVEADLAAAKAKVDAALAREPVAEAAVEAACGS